MSRRYQPKPPGYLPHTAPPPSSALLSSRRVARAWESAAGRGRGGILAVQFREAEQLASRVEYARTFEENAPRARVVVPRIAFSPRAFSAPRLERGRSGMHTLRMGDDSEAERLRSLSAGWSTVRCSFAGMAYRPGRGGNSSAYGGAAYDQYMESENDALVNGLGSKVSQLKELSIQIGADVREQNHLLGDLDNSFDNTGGLLGGTMKRLGALSKNGGDCAMVYLAVFVFFVFVMLWRLTK